MSTEKHPFAQTLGDVKPWDEVESGEFVDGLAQQALERGLSQLEFEYLLTRYPYLELRDANLGELAVSEPVSIVSAQTGWEIHDRGTSIAVGPGRLLFGAYTEDDDESGDGGVTIAGFGTLEWQAIQSAWELLALAHSRWASAEIVGGSAAMQRAAWIAAYAYSYDFRGFSPTSHDEAAYARLYYSGMLQTQLDQAKTATALKMRSR